MDIAITDNKGDDGKNEKVQAKLWDTTRELFLPKEGDIIGVELVMKPYNGAPSFTMFSYDTNVGIHELSEFLVEAPYTGECMYDNIFTMVLKEVPEGELVQIFEYLYQQNKDKLLVHGAAKAIHHNYKGGLLYHTVRMVAVARRIAEVYPSLDVELLMVGAALHDIGKLDELTTNVMGESEYSPEGVLFGHLYIGARMVRDAAWALHLENSERVRRLEHLILSHHGKQEWGAVAVPCIPEAEVLHEIDMIDSRMEIFEQETPKVEPGTVGNKVFGLGTCVYRPLPEEKPEA